MRFAIVGANPKSSGSECIVFGHFGRRSRLFSPISHDRGASSDGEISFRGDWDVRDMQFGGGAAHARALVARRIGADEFRSKGHIVVVLHRWSGTVQVNDIGRKYTIDLYSDATRLALIDIVDEIMIDITSLARADGGVLRLPKLDPWTLVEHVRHESAWFAFLERDADFAPGAVRRGMEWFRAPPSRELKLRVVSSLLPEIAGHARARPAPPVYRQEDTVLRDQMRLLSAAVDGLASRSGAKV